MERIEDRLSALVREALGALGGADVEVVLDVPRVREHGDFSTNAAMRLAAASGRPPREVAADLVARLPASPYVARAEVAGPGFVNLFLTQAWLHEALRAAIAEGDAYGRAPSTGRSVQIEFVSANPTGPLHLGHARNAAIGDGLASVLDAAGWRVEREYYFNDAGLQMERFGASVEARYLQRFGRPAEVPEDGYPGEYLVDVAADIARVHGDALRGRPGGARRAPPRARGARRVRA
ncbi:MAG: arginine--tRNA ligase, partial [Actinomycetota bacterium]